MPALIFLGNEGSPDYVEWNGVTFPTGQPVGLDLGKPQHRFMLEKARGNPFFEVDDDAEGIGDVSDAEIVSETQQEARAEPTDYIPEEDADAHEKAVLRATLKAAGQSPGPRTGLDKLREMVEALGDGQED